jgi:hypothetical protein
MDYLPAGRQVGKENRSNTIPCHCEKEGIS